MGVTRRTAIASVLAGSALAAVAVDRASRAGAAATPSASPAGDVGRSVDMGVINKHSRSDETGSAACI